MSAVCHAEGRSETGVDVEKVGASPLCGGAGVRSVGDGATTRRRTLQSAIAAAGVAASGSAVLAACARTTALPRTAAASPVSLVWLPWTNFPGGTSNTALALLKDAVAPFLTANKGVQITPTLLGGALAENGGGVGSIVAAMIAGQGPDVFEHWFLAPFVEKGFLLDLGPYIKRDNLDLAVWPRAAMQWIDAVDATGPNPHGTFALPSYINTLALAINQGVPDQLGVAYPTPDWTYPQWARFWESATSPGKGSLHARTGFRWIWYAAFLSGPPSCFLHAFGGGYVDPTDPRRAGLAVPGTEAFFEFLIPLIESGVVQPLIDWNNAVSDFLAGRLASMTFESAAVLTAAVSLGGMKWDWYPVPVGPAGRFSLMSSDYVAVNAATKHPDVAYAFAKWLAWDKTFATAMMKIALRSPGRNDQWEEWVANVKAVAPRLASKNFGAFTDVVTGQDGHLWGSRVWKYAPQQAGIIVQSYIQRMMQRQTGVVEALRNAQKQVDAFEATQSSPQVGTSTRRPGSGP